MVGHLACFSKINKYGFLEAPYFRVKNGVVGKEFDYLNAYEEEKYNIAHAGVPLDDNGNIISKKVLARTKGRPGMIEKNKVDYIDVSSKQSISAATALIPWA